MIIPLLSSCYPTLIPPSKLQFHTVDCLKSSSLLCKSVINCNTIVNLVISDLLNLQVSHHKIPCVTCYKLMMLAANDYIEYSTSNVYSATYGV